VYSTRDDDRWRHEAYRAGTTPPSASIDKTQSDMPALARTLPSASRGRHPYEPPDRNGSGRHAPKLGGHQRRPRQGPADEDDAEYVRRQLQGLTALMEIAESAPEVVPFFGAAVRIRYTGSFEAIEHQAARAAKSASRPESPPLPRGRVAGLWRSLRTDKMLRNALYLILNMGVQAALGFGFWIIAARYFSTASVGQATSLISASTLIAFMGQLGLNTALVKYLPVSRRRNGLITTGVTLSASCSAMLAIFYVILMPFVSRPISFVAHSLPLAIGFVVLTAGGGVNLITDSVFLAAGKASFCAITDGLAGGIAKIALVFILAGTGAFGVFGAVTGGFLMAALTSVYLIYKVLRWRPVFSEFRQVIRPIMNFSGVNYVGNLLGLLPTLVVPLIVISRVGSSAAAYYYVSFQLASLLYQAAYSVEDSFLAEGARSGTVGKAILMRSVRILVLLCVPSFIAVLLFGRLMLSAFGSSYGSNAESSLIPLTFALLPIAVYHWCLTVLRLSNQLRPIVWSNAVYAVAVIGLAWVLAPRGLGAVAMAWPLGTTVGALVAGVAAMGSLRRTGSANRGPRQASRSATS
jgi:O-antigen/teichoic acid export membrane protein